MKKKILFVIPNLGAGGAEKSLVNLLQEFDYMRYDVHLFMMSQTGLFLTQLPPEVKILSESPSYKIFSKRFPIAVSTFLLRGKWKLVWNKIAFTFINRTHRNKILAEQKSWKYFRKFFNCFPDRYDVAIGYLEKNANYIVTDCVKADKKMGYIHNDYQTMGLFPKYDHKSFDQLQYIISVSENCVTTLQKLFPALSAKFKLIENISSKKIIRELSIQGSALPLKRNSIVSIGRLSPQKNFELAVSAAQILHLKGYDLEWNIIGEGAERPLLENLINEKKLHRVVKLLGLKENPYPYIAQSLVYVQPSKFEGKSIAIDEAKILQKPIVATNFPTVYDQITSGETGLITEMNGEALAAAIEQLLTDESLRQTFAHNLSKEIWGAADEVAKLYQLIES